MDISLLREYAILAKDLNFTNTAARCHITQSALSKHIASMEAEIGHPLFLRTKGRVRPTPYGEAFAHGVNKILATYDETIATLRDIAENYEETIVVGYLFGAAHAFLNKAYELQLERHPETKVRLFSAEERQLKDALEANEADLIVTMVFENLNTEWFSAYKIFDDYFTLLTPLDHPFAALPNITCSQLSGQTILIPSRDVYPAQNAFLTHALAEKCTDAKILDTIRDPHDLVAQTKAGRGLAFAQSHLLYSLPLDNVRPTPITDASLGFDICAIWKKSRETPVLIAFVDIIRELTSSLHTDILRNKLS